MSEENNNTTEQPNSSQPNSPPIRPPRPEPPLSDEDN